MTNLEIKERLDFLTKGSCSPSQYIKDYYGISWPFEGELKNDYDVWLASKPKNGCQSGYAPRFEIEAFFRHLNVEPEKWMSVKLGMNLNSFEDLGNNLPRLGLRPARFFPYPGLVALDFPDFLAQNLQSLRFRTFSDHNLFCARLHDALGKMGLTIDPLFCETSKKLGDYPLQFAKYYDCTTLESLSVKHQVWLDFHKPLFLAPDRCSKLTYLECHELLKGYRAGRAEPENLDVYEQFLQGHN